MTEHISNQDLSPAEIELDQDIHTGEGSEGIDTLETHLIAKNTLHTMVDDAMQGKGESSEAVVEYISLMLVEAAQGYARSVQSIDDPTEAYRFGAELLHLSLAEMEKLADEHQCGISINTGAIEDFAEGLELQAEDLDPAEEFDMLEQLYGTLHQGIISEMLNRAQGNQNDLRRERHEALKAKMLDAAKDTVKIALGAAAAVVAVQFLKRK